MSDSVRPEHRLLTLGQIAKQLKEPTHVVRYAIDAYHIAHLTRVGILRCWTEADVPRIKAALARVAANRRGGLS